MRFQNIWGITIHKDKLKDELIRRGISNREFDIFGFAKTTVDYVTSKPATQHQFGWTAIFSIDKATPHVIDKGKDKTMLG